MSSPSLKNDVSWFGAWVIEVEEIRWVQGHFFSGIRNKRMEQQNLTRKQSCLSFYVTAYYT